MGDQLLFQLEIIHPAVSCYQLCKHCILQLAFIGICHIVSTKIKLYHSVRKVSHLFLTKTWCSWYIFFPGLDKKKLRHPTRPVEKVALTTKGLQKRKTQLLDGRRGRYKIFTKNKLILTETSHRCTKHYIY